VNVEIATDSRGGKRLEQGKVMYLFSYNFIVVSSLSFENLRNSIRYMLFSYEITIITREIAVSFSYLFECCDVNR